MIRVPSAARACLRTLPGLALTTLLAGVPGTATAQTQAPLTDLPFPAAPQASTSAHAFDDRPSIHDGVRYGHTDHGTFPLCDHPTVTARVIEKFNWAEEKTWKDGVRIAALDREHERSEVYFGPSPIPRRYCEARAHMENAPRHPRKIYYLIEGGMGLAAAGGYKVEFCMVGRDRWRVYDGWCRVLRK